MFRNNQKECQNEIDPKLSSDIVRYSPLGLFWPEKSLVGLTQRAISGPPQVEVKLVNKKF